MYKVEIVFLISIFNLDFNLCKFAKPQNRNEQKMNSEIFGRILENTREIEELLGTEMARISMYNRRLYSAITHDNVNAFERFVGDNGARVHACKVDEHLRVPIIFQKGSKKTAYNILFIAAACGSTNVIFWLFTFWPIMTCDMARTESRRLPPLESEGLLPHEMASDPKLTVLLKELAVTDSVAAAYKKHFLKVKNCEIFKKLPILRKSSKDSNKLCRDSLVIFQATLIQRISPDRFIIQDGVLYVKGIDKSKYEAYKNTASAIVQLNLAANEIFADWGPVQRVAFAHGRAMKGLAPAVFKEFDNHIENARKNFIRFKKLDFQGSLRGIFTATDVRMQAVRAASTKKARKIDLQAKFELFVNEKLRFPPSGTAAVPFVTLIKEFEAYAMLGRVGRRHRVRKVKKIIAKHKILKLRRATRTLSKSCLAEARKMGKKCGEKDPVQLSLVMGATWA